MKTKLGLVTGITAIVLLAAAAMADPLVYLDFDKKDDGVMSSGDQYLINWDERGTSVTAVYAEAMDNVNDADGPEINTPDGDGVTMPAGEGPQGGKVLQVQSNSREESLNFEMSSYYHTGDYTIEVCFWASTNDIGDGNTVGLQNIISNSWPCQNVYQCELRIIGNASGVGRPDDDRHIELASWEGGGNEVRIVSIDELTPQVWHTAQIVFDYNDIDPANSSITFYLDDVEQGTVTYDATASGVPEGCPTETSFLKVWGTWGTPAPGSGSCREDIGTFRFLLGGSSSRLVNGSDVRGFDGAIDAFAISEGALAPGEFVLPEGFSPPMPTSTNSSWQVYQ